MRGNSCFGFSYEQQAEIWIKWKNGDSLSDIGRALDILQNPIAFQNCKWPLSN